jgi:hypothetical protein
MNNQESINKFLTEKLLGKCWHVPYREYDWEPEYKCSKCQSISWDKNQDLFTPTGFFLLWEKVFEVNDEDEYVNEVAGQILRKLGNASFDKVPVRIINPLTFPILLAEFLGWKEGEE